jgi:putative glutathione S-transferase
VIPDTVNGAQYLRESTSRPTQLHGPGHHPVLWDKETGTIVNNESRDIIRMFDHEFDAVPGARPDVDFCPEDLCEEVNRTLDELYEPVNNGVYKTGFAATQEAHEEAVTQLFDALNHWEEVLGRRRYLCGERITEADWSFFATLVRFDPVYYGHFKCNLRRIADYPNLWGYLKDLYGQPASPKPSTSTT